jgi:hypothetical protein
MGLRKNSPAPESDKALEFLRKELVHGARPATEVKNAALREGVSPSMLEKVSKVIVDKSPITGPDGKSRSHWTLRVSPRRARKGRATIRKAEAEAAFNAGYKQAVNKMLQQLAVIAARKGRRPTPSQLIEEFESELRHMKVKLESPSKPLN